MTNKEPTQHQKSLAIAKAMYGEKKVHDCCDFDGNCYVEVDGLPFERFNPYINAQHSQAVQEFFKLDATYNESTDEWFSYYGDTISDCIISKDLKTAIADGACLVILENKK